MAIANLSIYYTWKNIKPAYNNNKFKISAPTWNDEFDLPDGSYSVSEQKVKKKKMKQIKDKKFPCHQKKDSKLLMI